jgi:hypothetical protein
MTEIYQPQHGMLAPAAPTREREQLQHYSPDGTPLPAGYEWHAVLGAIPSHWTSQEVSDRVWALEERQREAARREQAERDREARDRAYDGVGVQTLEDRLATLEAQFIESKVRIAHLEEAVAALKPATVSRIPKSSGGGRAA